MEKATKLIIVLFLICLFPACTTKHSTASNHLYDIKICSDLHKNYCKKNDNEFKPNTAAMFVSAKIAEAKKGDTVKVIWSFLGNDVTTSTEIDQNVIVVDEEEKSQVLFSISKPHGDWPTGHYEAHLLWNNSYEEKVFFRVTKK